MWSKKYEKCIKCGTNEDKYYTKGLCKKCYLSKWRKENLGMIREAGVRYYKNNSEKIKRQSIKWQKNNPEKLKEYYKKAREQDIEGWRKREREKKKSWRKKYPEKAREQTRLASKRYYDKNKKEIYFRNFNNVQRRIRTAVSNLINLRLKKRLYSKNGKSTFSFLPYTIDDLIKHLENQFKPGMSWTNHGDWHIDHKTPDCKFDYKSVEDEEFQKCWALENLQPLWAEENLKKSGKY